MDILFLVQILTTVEGYQDITAPDSSAEGRSVGSSGTQVSHSQRHSVAGQRQFTSAFIGHGLQQHPAGRDAAPAPRRDSP